MFYLICIALLPIPFLCRYFDHQCALDAVAFLHGTTLDERIVRVELDWGYHPSRRYGRGESGGQVRDEKRLDYDEGRGGYGRAAMYGAVPDPLAEAPQAADPGTIGATFISNCGSCGSWP